MLTEKVRAALRREITHRYAPRGALTPWLMAPEIEDAVRDAVRRAPGGRGPDAALAEDVRGAVRASLGQGTACAGGAVVLTRSDVRRWVRGMLAEEFPRVTVLAYEELDPSVTIEPAGRIVP